MNWLSEYAHFMQGGTLFLDFFGLILVSLYLFNVPKSMELKEQTRESIEDLKDVKIALNDIVRNMELIRKMRWGFFVLIVSLSIKIAMFIAPPSHTFEAKKDFDRAKEFIVAGMYAEAIPFLKKRIKEEPIDAEAHFQLGSCYLKEGEYLAAHERFKSCVKLAPQYEKQIAVEYLNAGSTLESNYDQAANLFLKAVQHDPLLKSDVAKACLEVGKRILKKSKKEFAFGHLHHSISLDLFSIALEYDDSLKQVIDVLKYDYGKYLLDMAKGVPEEKRAQFIEQAKKFLYDEEFNALSS